MADVAHGEARRSPTASTATSAPRTRSTSGTASPPPASRCRRCRASTRASGCSPTARTGPGSDGHEIDIIEYFGDKHPQGGLTSFIHWYKGKRLIKTGSWIKSSESFLKNKKDGWSKNYHVFSVQWTPERDHLPHRRQGDLAHVGPRLQGPAVPHPEPARLRLRGAGDAGQEAAAAHVRRLGARVGDPGLLTGSMLHLQHRSARWTPQGVSARILSVQLPRGCRGVRAPRRPRCRRWARPGPAPARAGW